MKSNQLYILIPMIAGGFYHLGQKTLKSEMNPFLVFFLTYFAGSLIMLGLYFFSTQSFSIKLPTLESKSLLSLFLITIGFMGIELGFLLVYRSGLAISNSSFISSLGTSIILLVIGLVFFQEILSIRQWLGLGFACTAIALLMK